MKIFILLFLIHEFQIVNNNILTVNGAKRLSQEPRFLNNVQYTKQQLKVCEQLPVEEIPRYPDCSNIIQHEYFKSRNITKAEAYKKLRHKEAPFVIVCEQENHCPDINNYLDYSECRQIQRNQTQSDVKQRIWLKVYKKCEQEIYPEQSDHCESRLKHMNNFKEGLHYYNKYCRYLYHKQQKINVKECTANYRENEHYIKYEYSNCLSILQTNDMINPVNCLENKNIYQFYRVACRKQLPQNNMYDQCKTSEAYALVFKKQCLRILKKPKIFQFMTFQGIQCGKGEKAIKHCQNKSRYFSSAVAWFVVLIVGIIGLSFFIQMMRALFFGGFNRRRQRKLLAKKIDKYNILTLFSNFAANFKKIKMFGEPSRRKLESFLKLNKSQLKKKRTHFARVLKQNDLNKPYKQYNINDTEKFLKITARSLLGFNSNVNKTLTKKVLMTVHKILKKISFQQI